MVDFTPENLTDDQIITLLQMLFTNMNNLDKVYYDMFINPIPMDVTLDRYDENGTLSSLKLPNRAKDKIQVYMGQGSPQGIQEGNIGSFYFDVTSKDMYYKSNQTERFGWVLLKSDYNFQEGRDYVSPTGNGSGLKDLNGGNVKGDPVAPKYGGTGTTGISGIIKGNGELNPCTSALPDIDYATPVSYVGMIGYFAGSSAPLGWLIANGQAVSREQYNRLFTVIGELYGPGDGLLTFNVPDLRGVFARGLDLGKGYDPGRELGSYQEQQGASSEVTLKQTNHYYDGLPAGNERWVAVETASLEFTSGYDSHPKNVALLPCIKY